MNHTLRTRNSLKFIFFFFIAVVIIFFSCKKNDTQVNIPGQPDLTTQVTASVSGFVSDENNTAVTGAQVNFGALSTTTDKYGYFEIKNSKVVKNGAVVTVSKDGYFKGIKTFTTADAKSSFCRITLMQKTIAGTINTSNGGTVTLGNGLKVSLPANAVVNASTKAAYTGVINVSCKYIDPSNYQTAATMPGDLAGIDSAGKLKSIMSYGMAVVELTGSSGELLQITAGQKATLTIPIPFSVIANAPATIPLWYFDEIKGYWKQEGFAIKTGNNYVGQVAHFSYWNCDYPFANGVSFTAKFVSQTGTPISNAEVNVLYASASSPLDSGGFSGCHGMTNDDGTITGIIPANTQLIFNVYSNAFCGVPFSYQVTTNSADVDFGTITVTSAKVAVITGNAVNCSNALVTNGYLILNASGINNRYKLNSDGSFSVSIALCSSNISANITVEDLDALKGSDPVTLNISEGNNSAGTLQACTNSVSQFFNYTLDGVNYAISYPQEQINYGYGFVQGWQPDYVVTNFDTLNIAAGSMQHFISFASDYTHDSLVNSALNVNITEFGSLGGYVSGNFSGVVVEQQHQNISHTLNFNFRAKRNL